MKESRTSRLSRIYFKDYHGHLTRFLLILFLLYSIFYLILRLLYVIAPPPLFFIVVGLICLYHFSVSESSFEQGTLVKLFHRLIRILDNSWNIWISKIIIIRLNLFIFLKLILKNSFKYLVSLIQNSNIINLKFFLKWLDSWEYFED